MSITIKHLDGPLAGQMQTFDDTVNGIVFGRDREAAQVVYPPEYDVVGRKHFALNRNLAGDYSVELFGSRYVDVDGMPVDSGALVKYGHTSRLGRKDGPSFKVEILAPTAKGLPVTAQQGTMLTAAEREHRLRTQISYGLGAVCTVLIAVIAYVVYIHSTLDYQIKAARA